MWEWLMEDSLLPPRRPLRSEQAGTPGITTTWGLWFRSDDLSVIGSGVRYLTTTRPAVRDGTTILVVRNYTVARTRCTCEWWMPCIRGITNTLLNKRSVPICSRTLL